MRRHGQGNGERACHLLGPFDFDEALGVSADQVFANAAIGRVHHQPFTALQIACDLVSRDGVATGREFDRCGFAAIQCDDVAKVGLVLAEVPLALQNGVALFALAGHQAGQLFG